MKHVKIHILLILDFFFTDIVTMVTHRWEQYFNQFQCFGVEVIQLQAVVFIFIR